MRTKFGDLLRVNEPLNPFPFLGGCWTKRRPELRLIYHWPSFTGYG